MQSTHPLWAVAFRPFFLFGSAFAALAMTAWVLVLSGVFLVPVDVRWHAHELLFGFFVAVQCGFLLTAAKNWASRPPVSGARLQGLLAVWLLGRAAAFIPATSPAYFLRFASALTPVLLLVLLWTYLREDGQKKNRVFLLAVALFAVGDVMSLLEAPPALAPFLNRTNGLWLGLHAAQWLIVLMSGKTMPLFIERATGTPIRSWPWVDRLASGSVFAVLAADVVDAPAWLLAPACVLAALSNGVRLVGFRPLRALRSRLLWLVVVGYGSLVAGYAGLAVVTWLGRPTAQVLHLFTAGALSAMVYAIMSRIALGHTGRPIAVSRVLLAGYVLVALGAVLRVVAGLWLSVWYLRLLQAGGIAFALAWGLYAVWSAPFLWRPRVDGKPG